MTGEPLYAHEFFDWIIAKGDFTLSRESMCESRKKLTGLARQNHNPRMNFPCYSCIKSAGRLNPRWVCVFCGLES